MKKQNLQLSNDYVQYKDSMEKTLSVITSKLNASEEIVQQFFPGKSSVNFYCIF